MAASIPGGGLPHGWDVGRRPDHSLDVASERSRAAHGRDSGLSWTTIAIAVASVLLMVIIAGLAIWAGASFSGGRPGVTSPAGG